MTVIKNNDQISIDAKNKTFTLQVSKAVLNQHLKNWQHPDLTIPGKYYPNMQNWLALFLQPLQQITKNL